MQRTDEAIAPYPTYPLRSHNPKVAGSNPAPLCTRDDSSSIVGWQCVVRAW
jgi:hypothetical protein